jgi:alkylhydroperoxidase/carboxymuconolactone decarboxylase family protein YurZ
VVEVKALLEFFDLPGKRHGIGGIALEHLNGDRAAVWAAKQAIDDLQRAFLAVAAIATLGKRAATSLHVA